MEDNKTLIFQALLKAQGEFETLKKTETADTGKFKYKYVDLEAVLGMVLPILHKNGLVMTQTTDIMGDMPVVVTTIYHAETGECVYGSYPLVSVDPKDPQKLGASLTYARRYALLALLGIATEDDDAKSASTSGSYSKPATSPTIAPHKPYTNTTTGEIVDDDVPCEYPGCDGVCDGKFVGWSRRTFTHAYCQKHAGMAKKGELPTQQEVPPVQTTQESDAELAALFAMETSE